MLPSAFLVLLAASLALAQRPSVLLPDTPCTRTLVRKEVRDLSQQEWSRYVAAVRRIQQDGIYDRLVKLHLDHQTAIHNFPMFLPWHRYYVRQFEMHLQRVDPSVTVPYWNWAFDAQAPETSDVLSAKYFGGNGKGPKKCVPDGAFSSWRPYYPRGRHCMRREYDLQGDAISSFYGPEVINSAITQNPTYDAFRQAIEYPIHAAPHTNIGSDFSSMASPNDPLFFSHHAFVDKIWLDWQQAQSGSRKYNGANEDGTRATTNDQVLPWSTTVGRVLDIRRLCYSYRDMVPGRIAPARPDGANPAPVDEPLTDVPPQQQGQTPRPDQQQTQVPPLGQQQGQTPRPGQTPAQTDPWNNNGGWWRRRLIRRSNHESRESTVPSLPQDAKLVRKPSSYVSVEPSNVEEPADAPRPPSAVPRPALYTAPPPKPDSNQAYNVSYADRTNLLAIRVPKPIPEWWANMNKIPLDKLRQREQTYAKVCVEVNKIPEYVSPCAIYNKDNAIARLSKKVKTFYAVVNGTKVVPAPAAYSPENSKNQNSDSRKAVKTVRDTVKSRGGVYLENTHKSARRFGDRLKRVIGVVVQPVLKVSYPDIAQPVPSYDDDEAWCDADYEDDAPPAYSGKQPISGDLFKGGMRPGHGDKKQVIQTPIASPGQTAYMPPDGYKKRVPTPAKQLNDGGDAYDMM